MGNLLRVYTFRASYCTRHSCLTARCCAGKAARLLKVQIQAGTLEKVRRWPPGRHCLQHLSPDSSSLI